MEKYEIITFKNDSVQIDVNVSPNEETVWLTLNQISELFGRDKSVISRHISKIFEEKELDEEQVVAKMLNHTRLLQGTLLELLEKDLMMNLSNY